jgi:hypothetical protein
MLRAPNRGRYFSGLKNTMQKMLILAGALALATLSSTAAAHGAAGYIRGEIGTSDVELNVAGLSDSDSDTSASFGGGYWFNSNFAIEGHLATLYTEEVGDDAELDLVSIGLGLAAKKNFGADGNGFFVGGRVGVARLTGQTRVDTFDVEDQEHATGAYFGAGVGYDFSDRFGLSLNWDRRQADFDNDVEVDVDTIALGGEFRF